MKRNIFVLSLLSLILLLSGCQSSVLVRHLRPAEVDMGSYRNLAVATATASSSVYSYRPSTRIVFSGSDSFFLSSGYASDTVGNAAKYASNRLAETLGKADGYFTVLAPDNTDNYLGLGLDGLNMLKKKGVNAVITSQITAMNIDEHPYTQDITENRPNPSDPTKTVRMVVGKKTYISQTVSLNYSYQIKDVQSGTVLFSETKSGKRDRDTLIGKRIYEGSAFRDDLSYNYSYAPSVDDMIRDIINSFQNDIARKLTPTYTIESISLMQNKPKDENIKNAYSLVDNGNLQGAYQMFLNEWKTVNHVPSGYNAALLSEALGNLDDAVALMNQVATMSGDSNAYAALGRMQQAQKDYVAAKNQINRTSSDTKATTTQVVTGF